MTRGLIAILAALALHVLAAPATAAVDTATIAESLAADPVYIDDSFDEVVSAADRAAIEAELKNHDKPIYVVIVPLREGDRFDGDLDAFLTALASRIGDPAAIFIGSSDRFVQATTLDDSEIDRRLSKAARAADLDYEAPIADKVIGTLQAYRADDLDARYERAQKAWDDKYGGGGGAPSIVPLVLTVLIGVAVMVAAPLIWRRARRGGVKLGAPPLLPDRVFENALAAQYDELRDRVRTEVIALSETIDRTKTPSGGVPLEHYERAVELSAAASKLHDRATTTVQLAAALVLVDDGREALRQAADAAAKRPHKPATPLCFFNPLHGRSAGAPTRWTDHEVPACAACAAAIATDRDPDVLREGGKPWFERAGAIATTGMGRFSDLAAALGRGEAP